jgi:hypothetical protein
MGRHRKLKAPESLPEPPANETAPVADTESEDEGPLLRRQLAHLELLQSTVEETAKAGEMSPALLRESSGLARALISLSKQMTEYQVRVEKAHAKLEEHEKAQLLIDYICTRPHALRLEAYERLGESLKDKR